MLASSDEGGVSDWGETKEDPDPEGVSDWATKEGLDPEGVSDWETSGGSSQIGLHEDYESSSSESVANQDTTADSEEKREKKCPYRPVSTKIVTLLKKKEETSKKKILRLRV